MATTIQVEEETLAALRRVKGELAAGSLDDVVRHLLADHAAKSRKLRGLTPGIGPFVRDHGHRD